MREVQVGVIALDPVSGEVQPFLREVDDSPLDHVFCGDHVSFFGAGSDGLIGAARLLSLTRRVSVQTGVYLLPLRHPVLVARQLSDLSVLGPGRFVFGVGVGGEDAHEFEVCGVDPRTRGQRMNESLEILGSLLAGRATTFHGEFFDVDAATIAPAPARAIPILIGGRSDVALRRAARYGDGWLGIWNSPRRFAQAVDVVATEAERIGRTVPSRHAMQVWCGVGDLAGDARARLAAAMEGFYRIPFERFEKYSPYGTAKDVAEFLHPYVYEGCTSFNLIPVGADAAASFDAAVEVRALLNS
jgi:alkanesulfonate monooxygenase SsuD/methylene tetrahydromethanopterin reductase-like flavin-dependent oxidoreductase (luciferase family)